MCGGVDFIIIHDQLPIPLAPAAFFVSVFLFAAPFGCWCSPPGYCALPSLSELTYCVHFLLGSGLPGCET